MTISQYCSTLLIGRCAKGVPKVFQRCAKGVPKVCQSSTHSACESDLFIFFIFHRKTNILLLNPQALIKMKVRANNNEVWKDFALTTATSKLSFIIFGDHKEQELFSIVKK